MNATPFVPPSAARPARADLHIHSRHSDRPSEWFLRRVGAPESFIHPLAVYENCRAAGMDFVTLSDHNTISGAQELVGLPGTFLSCELTTYFPADGCKVHLLVFGIDEAQFAVLQEARADIRELRDYVLRERIAHSVSHPLYRVNDRLTVEHFEQLVVLFNHFEGLNGSRDPWAGTLLRAVFEGLTPGIVERLADRHGIAPVGTTPWCKALMGGSDDHSGLYAARACTETPPAATVAEFLEHLREGRCRPEGEGGGSLRLASSLYRIAHDYYRERLLGGSRRDGTILGEMLRVLGTADHTPPSQPAAGLGGVFRRALAGVVRRHRRRRLSGLERVLADEIQTVLGTPERDAASADGSERIQTSFQIVQQLAHRFLSKGLAEFSDGRLLDGLQSVSSLAMMTAGVAPYFTAMASQHKDDRFLRSVAERFEGCSRYCERPGGMAWITDTLTDVNGVAHTVRTLATLAQAVGRPITVVACPREPVANPTFALKQFTPMGTFRLPEYEAIELSFPPVLEILHYLEQRQFSTLMVSTPGPLGLCALLAGSLLGIRLRGIYHTDFPAMADGATDDPNMAEAARAYMRWFYGRMEIVYAPTQAYVEHLEDLGIARDRIRILPRGVDLQRFNPSFADRSFWSEWGLQPKRFKYLYVGRVSQDKNVESLLKAHQLLESEESPGDLVVVGNGPQRTELQDRYAAPNVVFTGTLRDDALSRAYASADVLVFPSTTDTFGNVVLEAHASGLPAIVSDRGGPCEIVASHNSGLAIDVREPWTIAEAMQRMREDGDMRERCREGAALRAAASGWSAVLDAL